jgi:hypothetical protein
MRLVLFASIVFGTLVSASPAAAATIVVYTNPESLERRVVVVDPDGPDRVYMCMLPPGEAGCHRLPLHRAS